jgi:hypothetical protein
MDTTTLRRILEAQRDLYLLPNDKVVVVLTESFENAPIDQVLNKYDHVVVEIDDLIRPGQHFPLEKEVLGCGATVGWIISNISLSHSVGAEMINRGMFVISNPGMTKDWEWLLNLSAPRACEIFADALEKAIGGNAGGTVQITSFDGTNLVLEVPNGNWDKEVGKRQGVGTNGLFGEYYTAPDNANGTYVLQPDDFLTNPINRVEEKIQLTIKDNTVVKIQGGSQAEALRKMLESANNQLAFNLGEFAIGVNPAKPPNVQRSVVAEKLLGGIHIAIGTNAVCVKADCPDLAKFVYGRYNAGVHVDAIKFGSTVTFTPEGKDEEIPLLKDGKLMVM